MSKIVIVGGGAAGLTAGIFASKNNEVIILEKNSMCGKKILVTGNGRCNYFNEEFTIDNYYSQNITILNKIINNTNKEKVLSFFESIGIVPKIKNGCYYPYSNQAVTIKQALLKQVELSNVHIKTNIDVKSIDFNKNKFTINTNCETIEADKVIIATGSKAAIKNNYNGYSLTTKFGHSLVKPLPSLVQLKTEGNFLKEWMGIRSDVVVKLFENKQKLAIEKGEIQLTNYGVSGICVYQLSSLISRGLDQGKLEEIYINFVPFLENMDIKQIISFIDNRNKMMPNRNVLELLEGIINYKLLKVILKKYSIKDCIKWNDFNDTEKLKIVDSITNFKLKVIDTNPFSTAQVCSGGIPLNEININTMESLKQKNLYLIGEMLDVDGKCGGYNLGFAWLSGMIAGENAGEEK